MRNEVKEGELKSYGNCVGGGNTKVVVTMNTENNIINARSVCFEVAHEFSVFFRHVDSYSVRDVHRGCTSFYRFS